MPHHDRRLHGRQLEFGEMDLANAAFVASKEAMKVVKEAFDVEHIMGITDRPNRSYQDEHTLDGRWTSTDAYTADGRMLTQILPCYCAHCLHLHSRHRSLAAEADNGAVVFPEDDSESE